MRYVLVVTCLFVAACGGSDDESPETGPGSPTFPPGGGPGIPGGSNPDIDGMIRDAERELPNVQKLMGRALTDADVTTYIAITKELSPILSDVRDPAKRESFMKKQEEICQRHGLSGSLEWGLLSSRIDAAKMILDMKMEVPADKKADVDVVRGRLDEIKAANAQK